MAQRGAVKPAPGGDPAAARGRLAVPADSLRAIAAAAAKNVVALSKTGDALYETCDALYETCDACHTRYMNTGEPK